KTGGARTLLPRGIRRRSLAGTGPEHEAFGQGIRSETICPVDAHAGRLAGGEQPGQSGGSVDVGVYSPHHVMDHRPHGNHFFEWIEVDIFESEFAHEGELLVDHFLPEMADVQVYIVAVRAFEGAPLLLLFDEGLR